jgi:hypothetical protein
VSDIVYSTIVVKQVESALESGGRLLDSLPHQIEKLLDGLLWMEWKNYKGEVVRCETFQGFLGIVKWDSKKVEYLLKDAPKIQTKWREAMKMKPGPKDNSLCNNVTETKAITGNSKSYTLSRLKRELPELFERVCNKELSANAAAIQAGWRKVQTPLEKVVAGYRKLEPSERENFFEIINED